MSRRVLDYIDSQPWAITPEALGVIRSIAANHAAGRRVEVEAIERELGRPLRNTREVRVRERIAVVPVHGPLFRYANLFTEISGATSSEQLATDIGAAVADPGVDGIILDVDSPGGEVNGTEELGELIYHARSLKPAGVTALVSGWGTSGAYWLASAASQVVTTQTGVLGSIGAILRMWRQDDEDEVVFVSSQSPRKNLDPDTESGAAEIQALLDSFAEVFVSTVARNRGVSQKTVLADFGQGGLLVGQAAVDAGLADRVGTLEAVITQLSDRAGRSGPHLVAAGAAAQEMEAGMSDQKEPRGASGDDGPEITRAHLDAHHPDLVGEIRSEGHAAGRSEGLVVGATQERERILAIEECAVPGAESLIAEMKRDPSITPEVASQRVLQAIKKAGAARLEGLKADEDALGAPGPGAHAGAETAEDASDGPANEARIERAFAVAGVRRPSAN